MSKPESIHPRDGAVPGAAPGRPKPGKTPSGGSAVHALSASADPGAVTSVGAIFPVAIIGVGNMGAGMAQRLLTQGWSVHVCDLDTTKMQSLVALGAFSHASAARAARAAVVTIVCVVDAGQTETVLFGAQGVAAAMQPGQVVVLCPTLAPLDVEAFAKRLQEHGLHTVDAPMSGGPARARDGSMSLMVAVRRERV